MLQDLAGAEPPIVAWVLVVAVTILRWSTTARPAGPVLVDQACHPSLDIAGPPSVHRRPTDPDQPGNLHVRGAFQSQQHDALGLGDDRIHVDHVWPAPTVTGRISASFWPRAPPERHLRGAS